MTVDRTRARLALTVSLTVALSACSASQSGPPAGPYSPFAGASSGGKVPPALQNLTPNRTGRGPAHAQKRPVRGWLSARASSGKSLVYVTSDDGSNGVVYLYPAGGQAQQPIGAIVSGVSFPTGLGVDGGGSLYVANNGNNTVTVYPPGHLSPSVTYAQGVSTPQGVAVGSDGTVYIANETGSPSGTGSVTEYPAGSTSPSATISLPSMYAFAVALDASNNLYVSWFSLSSFGIEIYEYAPGSTSGTNLGLDLPVYSFPAFALAFDDAGNLVMPVESLDHNPPKYIEFFAPGATEPVRKINEAGLVDVVEGIAFPKSPRIFYVASANDHDWMKLTYRRAIPRDVVNIGSPAGLALSP